MCYKMCYITKQFQAAGRRRVHKHFTWKFWLGVWRMACLHTEAGLEAFSNNFLTLLINVTFHFFSIWLGVLGIACLLGMLHFILEGFNDFSSFPLLPFSSTSLNRRGRSSCILILLSAGSLKSKLLDLPARGKFLPYLTSLWRLMNCSENTTRSHFCIIVKVN